MPSLNSLPLSLSEILEAHQGPLKELEIWALLCQSAEALQDLILKGEAGGDEAFRHIVTPNTLLIRDNGTITLTQAADDLFGSLYIAPELEPNTRQFLSDTAFEKMFVYSLGRTLQVASEFGLSKNEVLSISYDLNSLLQAMSERNASVRLGLIHILEACALQASQHPHKPPHTFILSRLYKTVLNSRSRSSFCDSSYGSGGSCQSTMSALPGRARRPRPHVRHRREQQKSRSRSRSRSHSPVQSRDGQDSGFVTSSQKSSIPSQKTESMEANRDRNGPGVGSSVPTTVTSSQFLNTSFCSTESDHSEFGPRYFQALPYAAAHTVQGLLGLRQGSPAYQKYIQLKERQIRLKQARLGQTLSALNDVRSHLMTPTLLSQEMLNSMSENRSMASLMSFTLGTYKPNLHAQYGSAAAVDYSKDTEAETGSQLSLFTSGEYGDVLRAEEPPSAQLIPEHGVTLPAQDPNKTQPKELQVHQEHFVQKHPSSKLVQQLPSVRQLDSLSELTSGNVRNQREYCGPEFVFKNRRPAIKITMPPSGDSLKNAALLRKLTVVHLTGQKLEVVLDPSTTGQQLFDTVIPYLGLDEFYFFGLTYMSEGEHFFLDAETKLHKVAPESWKDGPRGQAFQLVFTLYIRIKFYPDSLTDFRHSSSYHLLYLQLRRDVLEERVTCNPDTLASLAGLALQAEYGDHNQAALEEHNFVSEHYFPSTAIRRFGAAVLGDNAMREYIKCAGIPDSQAEIEYIKHVRHLPEYGIHFHKLFKSKSNTDTYMWVGLSKQSLVLAEPEAYGRSIIQDHPWNSILKISFNRRRFSIQPKMVISRGKPPKINFYTSSYRKGRYLLQFSTDQHRFQIRMRTLPSNMETLSGDLPGEMRIQTVDTGVGDAEVGEGVFEGLAPSLTYVNHGQQAMPGGDHEEKNSFGEINTSSSAKYPLQYRSPPPYKPHPIAQILGKLHVFADVATFPLHASRDDLASQDLDDYQLERFLDPSSRSSSQDSALTSEKSEYEERSPPPYKSSRLRSRESKHGRRIFEATLEKEGAHGIGLTIVGGETTSSLDLGIFVKSVVPGGPAERDGRIMPGDRLIAIGGISLEGKQHREAVAMIRDGGPQITLLVSQIRPPGTIKKRNFHEDQAEFEKKLRSSILEYSTGKNDQDFSFSNDLETFLRFDDFANNVHSSSDSDNAYDSDERNYTKDPPFSSSSLSQDHSFSYPEGSNKQSNINNSKEDQSNLDTVRNQSINRNTSSRYATRHKQPHVEYNNPLYSLHSDMPTRSGRKHDAIHQLRDEQEIVYDCDRQILDWSSDDLRPDRDKFFPGLTEEDRDDLQILGDIAALEAEDSSSDSDFDTAIKKTIEGGNRTAAHGRRVSPVGPRAVWLPAEQDACLHDLTSVVIYEVILESHNQSVGIITNTPADPGFPKDGLYVKEIIPDSSAQRGGIIAIGDKILEVAGQSVEGSDSKTVQALLDSTSSLVTVKVSRSLHRDAAVTGKSVVAIKNNSNLVQHSVNSPNWTVPSHQSHPFGRDQLDHSQDLHGSSGTLHSHQSPPSFRNQPKRMSISQLIASAPTERIKPLEGSLPIAPPPPPLALTSLDHESNTQSDMDSDILDSSKSEIYNNAQILLIRESEITPRSLTEKTDKGCLKVLNGKDNGENITSSRNLLGESHDDSNAGRDAISVDSSTEFNEEIFSMKSALDKISGSEVVSYNSIPLSTDSSTSRSLFRQPRLTSEDEGKDEHDDDDDDDVVVTLYGNEQASVYETSQKEATSLTSAGPGGVTSEGPSAAAVSGESQQALDLESEIVEVTLKRDDVTFGFTVAGGASSGGCYIKQVTSDPAVNGKLKPGDIILKVNGQDMTSMDHIKAVTFLRNLPDVAHLQLLRYPSLKEKQDLPNLAQPGMMTIEFLKPNAKPANLGVCLMQKEIDGQTGIFVKRLKIGGIAHKDGRLLEGDRIVQANGIPFIGISKIAALTILREAREKVVLVVTRSDDKASSPEEQQDEDDDIDDDLKDSYVSPRKQAVDVPVIMSQEWLRELPLMYEPKDRDEEFVTNLLQSLTDLVEAGEHMEEFRNLHQMKDVGLCSVGKLPENKPKNRYRNVLPYDENRVKLLNQKNDYINGSHICMKVGDVELCYIACQGPVPESSSDFWVMVWQEKVNVIVMLTQEVEAKKVKCHAYWPQSKEDVVTTDDGSLVITLVRSYQLEDFMVAVLCLEDTETKIVRDITLLQYTSWPDHGAPDTALPILQLLQVVHLLENGSPPVVHCSAGIGRTGTFIAIDTALATIEQGLELDLYEIVRTLRTQRHGMIQTTEQYLFCYTACMEALLVLAG